MKYEKIEVKSEVKSSQVKKSRQEWSEVKSRSEVKKWRQGKNEVKSRSQEVKNE